MTCFNDRETPYPCLEMVDDKPNSSAKALILKVHPPVIGVFPLVRNLLDTPVHLTEWSMAETKDVMYNFSSKVTTEKVLLLKPSNHQNIVVSSPPRRDENLSSWRVPPSGFGEVRYTSGYWEWVEDVLARSKEVLDRNKTYDAIFASMFTYDHNENVLQAFCENWRPSTNTVATFIGELSISLWDLRTIGGLPIHGTFYDEVVPSAKELTHVDDKGKPFLPRSCSYLFSAFYRLTKGVIDEVSFRDWTKFWFRGPKKYAEPPQKLSRNRTSRPRVNHDPSGNIDMSFLPRTEEENAPFIELGVEESLRDETYLAAFLACWLCKFVLPNKKVDCIRATVFKVASLMAHGEKFSLAVPVLASIYRGLREISTSSNLGCCKVLLPIHYVYGWIGEYFETYYRVNRPQRGVRMWQISGEKMAQHFDLDGARNLFQQVNARNLHHLALIQKNKELHIDYKGELSNSWSDFFISLRSSFVTLRHDDDLIVEPYSPHRFCRQFGFCQDVPGVLIEHHYDGSLLALVQLWDSCVRLGSLSKLIIPMRPSDAGPLMTREYSDWWPAHRKSVLRRSTHIILKGPRKDDAPVSIEEDQLQLGGQGKLSHSSKSKVAPSNPPRSVKVISKSKNLKVKDTQVNKGAKSPSLAPKAATITASEAIDVVAHKRKKPSSLSDKGIENSLGVVPFSSDASKPFSPHGVGITSAASSSNESNASQEQHWKRSKKKPKDLNDQHCEFADLDSISIDTAIFEDGAAGSTMPLTELAYQLGLGDISSDVDVFDDCITSPNLLNAAKSLHLPITEVKGQVINENPSTKLAVPSSEKVELSQPVSTTNVEVGENQIGCSNVSKDLVRPLQQIASNVEPQKAISAFKLSYVSGMWRTLCECITQFPAESSESLKELEKGVALILKGLREINIVDISPLEVMLEDFFKKYGDYDATRLSTSQKITSDSHQELLSTAQHRLHTANEEKIKMDKHLGELQKVLARAEKELEAWTSKKEKTISLIEEHQKRLSKKQESITISEDAIHVLEKISPLSETEIEELAKLKEDAETSRHQILSHKLFP